jgi:uncharacterized protein YdhG (YjbR/CyaY superfamily)
MTETRKPAKRASAGAFTADERAAMKDHAAEVKASARRGAKASKADGEADVLEKIAALPEADRAIAERLHALIKDAVPDIETKTWYGMPAYARNGDTICFFQPASKFRSRYATLGFSDKAKLDDGDLWPVYYALPELTAAAEARIVALVRQAAS